jgi:murein L,D-transpeptidase YcbB/YkuD
MASAQDVAPERWNREAASALLAYVERIDSHGLDPSDYAPAELLQAIQSGASEQLESRASYSFGLVARDLASGHVRPGNRGRIYIASDILTAESVARLIDVAIASKNPAAVLERLAPADAQYAALRKALAAQPAGYLKEIRQLEANLERHRWMPRRLGVRYLIVNIPEYRLRLFDGGAEIASYRVIAESVGRLVRSTPGTARQRGYTWQYVNGGLQVTQQPGPTNALGQMKLDMPNPLSVYVHDTPAKDLFERDARSFSHGCIRTQLPFDLAEILLRDAGWTRSMIDDGITTLETKRVALISPVPVHVVYLTAVARPDGSIEYLGDPYSLDAALIAKLQ